MGREVSSGCTAPPHDWMYETGQRPAISRILTKCRACRQKIPYKGDACAEKFVSVFAPKFSLPLLITWLTMQLPKEPRVKELAEHSRHCLQACGCPAMPGHHHPLSGGIGGGGT